MWTGWAPSEAPLSLGKSRPLDFFSRLDADLKCMSLHVRPYQVVKNHRAVPLSRKPSSLLTLIKEELDQVSNETPQSSENIDAFLHGSLSSLNAIRAEIRWSLGLDSNSVDKQDLRLEVPAILVSANYSLLITVLKKPFDVRS
jgi:hypothetical protein